MRLRIAESAKAAAVWIVLAGATDAFGLTLNESQPPPDKSGYSLFNPTPATLLREFTTDRPDKTESPYTVDAGHYQIELDLLSYSHDREGNRTVDTFSILPVNVKVGLLNNVDLQVVAETYNVERTATRDPKQRGTLSGFGDVLVRLKANIWGNDHGETAFGVMPFVKIPSNQNGLGNKAVEGGIIFPLAIKLPHEFEFGAMTEIDFVQNENSSDYHREFINSVTVGHAIVGELSGYAEFFSSVSSKRSSEWIGTFDVGATYKVTANVQIDTGVNIGVTRAADDINPFVGLSVRY